MKRIDVYPLPSFARDLSARGVSVAIDVLRATTTIATALANGAAKVVPFASVEETFAAKRALLAERPQNADVVKLGGERGGLPIKDFDFGNSPDLYTRDAVGGKTLLFTTTNGTKAILACRGAAFLAAFVNLQAVVERIEAENVETISIVCAGTRGEFTEEDLLCAGAIVDRLTARAPYGAYALNVQAEVSREEWRRDGENAILAKLRASRGGINLRRIKLDKDIVDAAKIDALGVVPEFRVGEVKLTTEFARRS